VEKRLQEYTLMFSSLKDGEHQFSFNLDKSFFDCFEHSLIESGDIQIDMELKKSETMLVTNYTIQGTVDAQCYRCNDPIQIEIEGDFRLVFKFGNEESDNEELIVLPHEAYQLTLADYFYEFVHVLLPNRIVHEEGDCNEEMVEIMKQYLID
jgi:uncharacterized metal-binding protein YceD (DUF177 family)